MDQSMRMVIIAGVLMLALLIAVIGSVSADSIAWHSAVANIPSPTAPTAVRSYRAARALEASFYSAASMSTYTTSPRSILSANRPRFSCSARAPNSS